MMTSKRSEWKEIKLEFFKEEVLSRFWNHQGKTEELIIEIQYMPALLYNRSDARVFIGAGISLEFPYNQRKENLKSYLEKNIEELKMYEKNHALGFVMTGDNTYKIDCITLAYHIKSTQSIFMQNFGENYKENNEEIIMLWYNLKKDGKVDDKNVKPGPESMIRIRYLQISYFMETIKEYVESGFKNFPVEFIKDDYKIC